MKRRSTVESMAAQRLALYVGGTTSTHIVIGDAGSVRRTHDSQVLTLSA